MRAQGRIDAGRSYLTQHRNPLRCIFDNKHCDLRVFQESAIDELLSNEVLQVHRVEAGHVNGADQRKNDVASIAYAKFSTQLGGIEHAHFEEVACANRACGATSESRTVVAGG